MSPRTLIDPDFLSQCFFEVNEDLQSCGQSILDGLATSRTTRSLGRTALMHLVSLGVEYAGILRSSRELFIILRIL
jgi:hypothetical protein